MNEATPGIGHNQPSEFDDIKSRADELIEAADAWAKAPAIDNEVRAERLSDFLAQLRAALRKAEDARKAEKQPHMDAAKAIDDKYRPIAAALEKAGKLLKGKLTEWLQAEERRRAAERAKAEREAREKAAAAAKAAQQADGTISGAMKAEQAQAEAEAAAAKAEQIDTRAGVKSGYATRATTLRTRTAIRVVDVAKVPVKFLRLVEPEAVEKALRKALRDGKIDKDTAIAGVEITEVKEAA